MSRPLIITSQPRRCISRAISFPMPPEEPVTCSFDDAPNLQKQAKLGPVRATARAANLGKRSFAHRHVTHQRHPSRQICIRRRVHHHRRNHSHPHCSCHGKKFQARGRPRKTIIFHVCLRGYRCHPELSFPSVLHRFLEFVKLQAFSPSCLLVCTALCECECMCVSFFFFPSLPGSGLFFFSPSLPDSRLFQFTFPRHHSHHTLASGCHTLCRFFCTFNVN